VIPGSPADKAGVRRGDVITRIDEKSIPDPNTLLNHLALLKPGVWVEVGLNRGGKALVFKARITKRSEGETVGSDTPGKGEGVSPLGLGLQPLTPALRRDYGIASGVTGPLIAEVQPGSRADKAGLLEGDVIVEANRTRIRNPSEFHSIVGKSGKAPILLVIHREGETFYTTL